MSRNGPEKVECREAPQPIGPYSQAVSCGDYVFVSGQIPLDPETGELIRGGIREQTSLVIDNAENILRSCGLGLGKVIKVDVFLQDLQDFAEMNGVYAERFTGDVKPSRCVVQVAKLPKGSLIELSCIAYKG